MATVPLLVLTFSLALPSQTPKGSQAASPSKDTKPTLAESPENALRDFLVALMFKDEKAIRARVLSLEGVEWLLAGKAPPADQAKAVRASMARMPIRVLKPNETIEVPARGGSRKITVQPEETEADRAVLLPEGAPVPTRMRQVKGRWKVDASPIVAARKAAAEARRKAEAGAPKGV